MESSPRVQIRKFLAPLDETDLLALLRHKGQPWLDHIRSRIRGECGRSLDHFFLAYAGREPVAHVWYTVAADDRRLGHLGHVYTRPDFRRQGLSARLLKAAMADFRSQGGLVMQLYTSNPVTVPFYEKLGFENLYASRALHDKDWYMRHPLGSATLIQSWFARRRCTMRELGGDDLAKYCLLYDMEYDTRLKDWAQGIGTGLESEYTFILTRDKIARHHGVCWVLENGETIVGAASLMRPAFTHQAHLAAVDCYLHPRFHDRAAELIEACLSCRDRLGVEVVYALCVDPDKARTYESLGFAHRAMLPGHYKINDQHLDCRLYQI